MQIEEIEQTLNAALSLDFVKVKSDGSHFSIIAVSDQFEKMSRVQKQQAIYAPLQAKITDGTLHAITIKTFTNAQWQREKLFHS